MANPLNPTVALQDRPANIQSPPQVLRGAGAITDKQLADQTIFTHTLKKMRGNAGQGIPTVTDQELATAVKGEHSLVDAATVNHGGIQDELQATRAQLRNLKRVLYNAKQVCGEHKLEPLEVEDLGGPNAIGTQPNLMSAGGEFPDTVSHLDQMTAGQVTALKVFYHNDFGILPADRLAVKVSKVRNFVGR